MYSGVKIQRRTTWGAILPISLAASLLGSSCPLADMINCTLRLPSSRCHLSYDDCPDDKTENYHNCSVLCMYGSCTYNDTHTHYEQFLKMSVGLGLGLDVCGLLIPTEQYGLLLCLSVCQSSEPCKKISTDRDAVWGEDSGGPKESCIRSPRGKGQFWGKGRLIVA